MRRDDGWDNANRLTGIIQGSTSIPFGYDNADRRTSLTLPNGIVQFLYDGMNPVQELQNGARAPTC
ncbi:MAG: hypothetical protein WCD12_03735 [Candidatus Binatus sp.]|jgi:YD repeat-containing protein|uniref:hypothetical protein n=1 Tax=Candidatus Binatus sp. TaxID=2811406 RepID=UPI003C726A1C